MFNFKEPRDPIMMWLDPYLMSSKVLPPSAAIGMTEGKSELQQWSQKTKKDQEKHTVTWFVNDFKEQNTDTGIDLSASNYGRGNHGLHRLSTSSS